MGTQLDDYRTQSSDTTREVEEFMFSAYRRMDSSEKIAIVSDLIRAYEGFTLAGLRERFPDATDREHRLRLACMVVGQEVVRDLVGFDPDHE